MLNKLYTYGMIFNVELDLGWLLGSRPKCFVGGDRSVDDRGYSR